MGDYYFIMNKNMEYVIDVKGGDTSDDTPLIIYPQKSSDTDNQLWQFETSSTDGYYFLRGQQSQRVIDVEQKHTGDESPLIIFRQKSSGTDNQLWQLVPSGGYFYIRGQQSQKVIDSKDESTSQETSVVINTQRSGADTQLWQFVKPMDLSSSAFSPSSIEINAGFVVKLTWAGDGSQVTVSTFDASNRAYPLFGGDSNAYSVSNTGTPCTVPSDVPEGTYYIDYLPPREREPVRGTINVKRAIKTSR